MASESLQYEVNVNLDKFNNQMKKMLVTTAKTGATARDSFSAVEKTVKELETTMAATGAKFGKTFSLGRSEILKDMKLITTNQIMGNANVVESWRKTEATVKKFESSLTGVKKNSKTGFNAMKKGSSEAEIAIRKAKEEAKKLNLAQKAIAKQAKITATAQKAAAKKAADAQKASAKRTKDNIALVKKLALGYLSVAGAIKIMRKGAELVTKVVTETGILQTAGEKWEIFTGSVGSAQTMLKELYDFSHRTPFTFKDVNKAATQLFVLTDGALQGVDAITQMADRAALAKVPMAQLTTWWGRLYSGMQSGKPIGRALTRMQQLGIVSGKLRNEIDGLSKTQMMDGTGWKMFIEGTAKAEGSIERLSQTIEGKLSTLDGVWDALFAFEDKDMQKGIATQIQSVIDLLNKNKKPIQEFFTIVMDGFSKSLNFAITSIGKYMKYFNKARDTGAIGGRIANIDTKTSTLSKSDLIQNLKALKSSGMVNSAKRRALEDEYLVDGGTQKGLFEAKQKAAQVDPLAQFGGSSYQPNSFVSRYAELQKKDNDITAELNATNKYLALKIEEATALSLKKKTAPGLDGFTGGTTGGGITSDNMTAAQLAGITPYLADQKRIKAERHTILTADYDARMRATQDDTVSSTFYAPSTDEDKSAFFKKQQKSKDDALALQMKYFQTAEDIISTSNNAILNIHKTFSSSAISVITEGMSGLASNTKSILSSLTASGVGGLAGIGAGFGIAGAALGVVSTIAGLIEAGSANNGGAETEAQTIASRSNRANIVSSGPENVYVTNAVTIQTGYIGSEGELETFVYNEVAPILTNATAGSLG